MTTPRRKKDLIHNAQMRLCFVIFVALVIKLPVLPVLKTVIWYSCALGATWWCKSELVWLLWPLAITELHSAFPDQCWFLYKHFWWRLDYYTFQRKKKKKKHKIPNFLFSPVPGPTGVFSSQIKINVESLVWMPKPKYCRQRFTTWKPCNRLHVTYVTLN